VFSQQRLDVHQLGAARFGAAIGSSPDRFALVAALDHWALLVGYIKLYERRESLARHGVSDNKTVLAGFTEDPQLARLLELTRAVAGAGPVPVARPLPCPGCRGRSPSAPEVGKVRDGRTAAAAVRRHPWLAEVCERGSLAKPLRTGPPRPAAGLLAPPPRFDVG